MTDITHSLGIKEALQVVNRQDAYYHLVETYMQGPEEVREMIRRKWDFGVEWEYPNPRRLACLKNETHSCRERARALLTYEAIMDLRQGDPRDELMTLALVYHGCLTAGIDPKHLFEEVASVSTNRTARFLLDFVARPPEDKSLDAFMLAMEKNGDGEIEIFPCLGN